MLRRLAAVRVPLYYVIMLILAAFVSAVVAIAVFKETIYQYEVLLRDDGGELEAFRFGSWPALANADFFLQVRERMIGEGTSFIEADLSTMRLTVYDQGNAVKTVPIKTKGKEGSWWETPAGLYKIQGKEENHFSAFAGVYLPWSLPFQGNFFIHGWPYYAGGMPVESRYSGGCIRLDTEDAKAVYELVKVGTPVLVFERDFAADGASYEIARPAVTAAQYLAADLKSNFVFLKKGDTERVPIASITKLVTALVATDFINIEEKLYVPPDALHPTSKPRLRAGQEISVYNLLYPLLLESSNEAAEVLARALGRDRFVVLMNDKARALGMANTVFVDPSGAAAENISTAEDLFRLVKYLYNNRSFLLELSAGKLNKSIYGKPIYGDLGNFNLVLDPPGFLGGKVGLTEASGETRVAVFELPLGGERRPVAVIALGSLPDAPDVGALASYVKTNYVRAGQP